MSRMTKAAKAERDEAIAKLREMLPPGSVVYTILRQVSRSGMSRHISVVVADCSDERRPIQEISFWVSRALGYRRHAGDGGLVVGGGGMDMGFHLVYCLGRTLYPQGGPLAKSETIRQIQAKREGVRKEVDGGYLLRHEWL